LVWQFRRWLEGKNDRSAERDVSQRQESNRRVWIILGDKGHHVEKKKGWGEREGDYRVALKDSGLTLAVSGYGGGLAEVRVKIVVPVGPKRRRGGGDDPRDCA